jgi:succinate dehydrogenase / fumarate reductase membrane anchor subunit
VVQYYSNNPIVPIMEGFFLFFVVTHSLTGVRSIFLDLNPSRSVRRVMDIVLIGIGVVSIVYGFWLLGAILAQAPAA